MSLLCLLMGKKSFEVSCFNELINKYLHQLYIFYIKNILLVCRIDVNFIIHNYVKILPNKIF